MKDTDKKKPTVHDLTVYLRESFYLPENRQEYNFRNENGYILTEQTDLNEFTVELNNGLNKLIEVSDVTGRVILITQSLDNKTVVNLKEIAHGIYYVKIKSDNSVEVIKVIKN